jgi:hypothetical protein
MVDHPLYKVVMNLPERYWMYQTLAFWVNNLHS